MMAAHSLETAAASPHWTTEGEIKLTLWTGLEIETEGMETAGELPVVVEIFVVIGLPVTVKVVIAGDLIIRHCIDHVVHDRQPQCLMTTSSNPPPCPFRVQ